MNIPGAGAGGGGLGGVLLDVAEFGNSLGEGSEPGDEQDRGKCRVAGQVCQRAE
jgi:hypothetical protein